MDIVKQENQLPMVADNNDVISSDILVPRLLLSQALSEFVVDGVAKQGELIKSLTGEVVGGPDQPVDIVPLHITNHWVMFEEINGKYEYRTMEPRFEKDSNLPWEFQHNGAKWKRVKAINLFALLLKDIQSSKQDVSDGEMPDLDKVLLPVMISFRSTSFAAGKVIATHFAKAKALAHIGAKPWGYSLVLKSEKVKNDKGTFFILNVDGKAKPLSKESTGEAEAWVSRLKASNVAVDESFESEVTEVKDEEAPF